MEYKLHVAIIDHIKGQKRKGKEIIQGTRPFRNLFVTHIFQGRSAEDGFFLKQMGVFPGVADLLCIWDNAGPQIGFLEVKTEKGYLSTAQKKFKGICQAFGVRYALVRSVADAHRQLKDWGVHCVHDSVVEPDIRSWDQKLEDAKALWKPNP